MESCKYGPHEAVVVVVLRVDETLHIAEWRIEFEPFVSTMVDGAMEDELDLREIQEDKVRTTHLDLFHVLLEFSEFLIEFSNECLNGWTLEVLSDERLWNDILQITILGVVDDCSDLELEGVEIWEG